MNRITIGRAPDNDIVFNEPSISSHHAEITSNGEYITCTDHSTNGTWMNGKRLHNASCHIHNGDHIMLPGNMILDWTTINKHLKKTIIWEYPQTNHDSMTIINQLPKNQQNHAKEMHANKDCQQVIGTLSLGDAITNVFTHYADFSGRARRSEFWWFYLVNMVLSCIPYLGIVWALVAIIPSLAVAVRRLHDIGKSGWSILLGLIPIVGTILLIIWYCQEGDPYGNQYGENPKKR